MGAAALHQGNIAEMEDRRRQNVHARLPQLPDGAGACTVEPLPGQARLGVDGPIHRALGVQVGLVPVRDDAGKSGGPRTARPSRTGHQQRVRVRLPARQHGDAHRGLRLRRPPMRDRGRGRHLQSQSTRPGTIDHQRHGGGQRQVVRDVRSNRAAAEARRRLEESKFQVADDESGVAKVEEMLGIENLYEHVNTPLVHHMDTERAFGQGALQARRRVRGGRRRGEDRRRVHRGVCWRAGGQLEGLHQVVERGQGGRPHQGRRMCATTTQNYFKMYEVVHDADGAEHTV